MSEVKNSVYEKLTPQRKQLVDKVLENLENGAGLWKQGWEGSGLPESAITGRKYHGVNSLFLMFVAMDRGYTDNRWLTYNQMKEKGWEFKKGEDGKTLGHGAGVNIEYFELRDRETKQPFDSQVLDGMDAEERAEYLRDGKMHRNTFLNGPALLDRYYRLRTQPRIAFAGQVTGVEGYVESCASGMLAALELARRLRGLPPLDFPRTTAIGALALYVSGGAASGDFQPMNVNFGIIEHLDERIRGKRDRYLKVSERALGELEKIIERERAGV